MATFFPAYLFHFFFFLKCLISRSVTSFYWVSSSFDVVAAAGLWLSFASTALAIHEYLTGERVLTTSGFAVSTARMKQTLHDSVQTFLPKSLLEKLRHRKLYVNSYEEQQARGDYFKLV